VVFPLELVQFIYATI